jgi:hypothetical protein
LSRKNVRATVVARTECLALAVATGSPLRNALARLLTAARPVAALVAARPIAALAAAGPIAALTAAGPIAALATAGLIAARAATFATGSLLAAALSALLSAQLAKLFVAVEFRAVGISVDWIFHGMFLRRKDFG